MKIFFDNVNFSSRSGPNSFAFRLAENLNKKGHEICGSNECDIHLAFIEQQHQKNKNAKLIQRLDGIWFKPEEFLEKNVGIKRTYDAATAVIWQTEFDKIMITKHWGDKRGSVIGNGIVIVETPVTHPKLLEIKNRFKTIFVCAANWHRQKRLKENVELFLHIQNTNPNSCLFVCGGNPDYIIEHPAVFYFGDLSHDILMQVYAMSNWMIHLAWLDHFPNTVVEAISKGVPVIHTNSGGTREVVRKNGIEIIEQWDYDFSLLDYENPPKISYPKIELKNIDIEHAHLCIDAVGQIYENFLNEVKNDNY